MTHFKIIESTLARSLHLCDVIFHPTTAWPQKVLQLAKLKIDEEVLSQAFKCLPIKSGKLRHSSVFIINLPSSAQALELHFI